MSQVRDAIVIGHGLPGLLTALDLAEVGLSVVVIAGGEDLPRGAQPDPDGVLAAALERVAAPLEGSGHEAETDASPRLEPPRTPLLLDPTGAWAEQAEPAVLGIPSVPLAERTLRLLGTAGALRAYRDRIAPLLTIGKTRFFGELVRKRLGRAALERLSEPLLRERYGVPAERVEVAVAAPGLNETLSRAGSLTAAALAYSDRNVARETRVAPAGGWERFREVLLQRLVAYGVELRDETVVRLDGPGDAEGTRGAVLESGEVLHGRALVLSFAEDPRFASPAVSPEVVVPELTPTSWRLHAEIDILPVQGVPAGSVAVRTLDDWSLRIEGLHDRGRAILRGPAGEAAAQGEVSESELLEMLASAEVTVAADAEWETRVEAAPFRTVEERHRVEDALRVRLAEEPEMLPLGCALHGGDLAAATESAHEAAVHLRRHLLGLAE